MQPCSITYYTIQLVVVTVLAQSTVVCPVFVALLYVTKLIALNYTEESARNTLNMSYRTY